MFQAKKVKEVTLIFSSQHFKAVNLEGVAEGRSPLLYEYDEITMSMEL